jgi:hypothetical protein
VALIPRAVISDNTRSASSWWPHPGTSQTPQEMGAAARRLVMMLNLILQ